MIGTAEVSEKLRARLGFEPAVNPELLRSLSDLMNSLESRKMSLSDLSKALENRLFDGMYRILGPGMKVSNGDGTVRRVMLTELNAAADDLMALVMEQLPVNVENCRELRECFMRSGSASAAQILCRNYREILGEEEANLILRLLLNR